MPTLYFAEGLPWTVVNKVSVVLLKNLSMGNGLIGVYTSLLYIPWTFKLFWAPLVDMYGTRRGWLIVMQMVLSALSALLAVAIFLPNCSYLLLAGFAAMGFVSATQDIAIDGYYLSVLPPELQAFYVGIRTSAYKVAWIVATGGLVYVAGTLAEHVPLPYAMQLGWSCAFAICTILFAGLAFFHLKALPIVEQAPGSKASSGSGSSQAVELENDMEPQSILVNERELEHEFEHEFSDAETGNIAGKNAAVLAPSRPQAAKSTGDNKNSNSEVPGNLGSAFTAIFLDFLDQPRIAVTILYVLIFRLGDAFLMKMAQPFLLDPVSKGGLGLSTANVGLIDGTIGTTCLLLGGIIGGGLIAKLGLRKVIMPFAIIQNSSLIRYWLLALSKPNYVAVGCVDGFEQFSYGLGTAAYTCFLLMTVKEKHQAAQYAIVTAFMALGVMIPGLASGFLTMQMGYANFFLMSFLVSLPGIALIPFLPVKDFIDSPKPKAA